MKAAAQLAAMRRRVRHKCPPPCGKSFVGISKAIYCSNRCRQRAKYHRKRAVD